MWYCLLLFITEPAKLTHFELGNIESDNSEKTVFLKCIASGVPRPTITWYNSRSKETVEADEEAPDKDGNYVSKLILKNGEDVGHYACAVKNKYLDEPIQHSFAAPIASELIKIFVYTYVYMYCVCLIYRGVLPHTYHNGVCVYI